MNLSELMPETAAYVAECRRDWGDEHVRRMVALAMKKGQRNCFWAVERVKAAESGAPAEFRVVGAPFDAAKDDGKLQALAAEFGQVFVGMMRPPYGWKPPPAVDDRPGPYCVLSDRSARS